jgi:predicted NAD/FAD-dependent oxidoreductase
MNCVSPSSSALIIGAGMAGATCARALEEAGCVVQVVDKARGAGGRLATRRLEWLDALGHRRMARLDHGAPAITARGAEFRQFLARVAQAGLVMPWWPALAAGSRPLDDVGPLYLPREDMPSLCRWLLRDIPTTLGVAVDRLQHGPLGWHIEAAGSPLPGYFDAVVLALPPAQAAALLAPHRVDWAQRASLALMQPSWTLLGVAHPPARPLDWNVARPERGPLAWIMRNDARPGREPASDAAHWVAHARAGWSRQHLEQPIDWVRDRLQAALQDGLGELVEWQHAVVHRWRYALPQGSGATPARQAWWDGSRGLGVCGDFLGGTGVEGAWLSAQALGDAMVRGMASASAAPATPPVARPTLHIAA